VSLPQPLPVSELPSMAIEQRVYEMLLFGWKRAALPSEPPLVNWFRPDGERLAQLDGKTVWLSTELVDDEEELARTIGHEVAHAKQLHTGLVFAEAAVNEASAQAAEEPFLAAWQAQAADLEAQAKARATIVRFPFPGAQPDTPPEGPCPHLQLKGHNPPPPAWAFSREKS
jgi:Zn-dependent protease with chaperone function